MPARRPMTRRKRQNVQRRLLRPSDARAPGRTREGGEIAIGSVLPSESAEEPEHALVGVESSDR